MLYTNCIQSSELLRVQDGMCAKQNRYVQKVAWSFHHFRVLLSACTSFSAGGQERAIATVQAGQSASKAA